MRFDYTGVISASADTGDPIVIFRPEVRIRVHGPNGSGDFLALVDTGADNTILPESVARALGIPVVPGHLVLGHQSFLDYFTATFIGEDYALDLEPNSHLPQITGSP